MKLSAILELARGGAGAGFSKIKVPPKSTGDGKRWKATATYRKRQWTRGVYSLDKVQYEKTILSKTFEELREIHDWIERGPDWRALVDVRITLQANDGMFTLEDSENE